MRLWLNMHYHRFPVVGYLLAFGLCLVVVAIGGGKWNWELIWFIVLPALFGVAHFAAPRDRWGGLAYWTLAIIWLAAAIMGVFSHWERLDPATPWLSLTRYALVVVGGTMALLSQILGNWGFAANPEPLAKKWFPRAVGLLQLLAFWLLVCVVLSHISFSVALAPQYRGGITEIVFVSAKDEIPIWLSWSPDSSRFIMLSRNDIWLVEPRNGAVACTQAKGRIFRDRPWLPSGEGFLFTKEEGERVSVWIASAEGKPIHKLLEDASSATFAPDGKRIAFGRQKSIWIADIDGSHARLLVKDGSSPTWAPDGNSIVFYRRPPKGERNREISLWITSMSGQKQRLPFQSDRPMGWHWLTRNSYAIEVNPHDNWLLSELLLVQRSVIQEHTLEGDARPLINLRSGFNPLRALAVSADGMKLAFGGEYTDTMIRDVWFHKRVGSEGWINILDLDKKRIRRIRGPMMVWEMAWSPDGRSLAIIGTDLNFFLEGQEVESASKNYVTVVSNL